MNCSRHAITELEILAVLFINYDVWVVYGQREQLTRWLLDLAGGG